MLWPHLVRRSGAKDSGPLSSREDGHSRKEQDKPQTAGQGRRTPEAQGARVRASIQLGLDHSISRPVSWKSTGSGAQKDMYKVLSETALA